MATQDTPITDKLSFGWYGIGFESGCSPLSFYSEGADASLIVGFENISEIQQTSDTSIATWSASRDTEYRQNWETNENFYKNIMGLTKTEYIKKPHDLTEFECGHPYIIKLKTGGSITIPNFMVSVHGDDPGWGGSEFRVAKTEQECPTPGSPNCAKTTFYFKNITSNSFVGWETTETKEKCHQFSTLPDGQIPHAPTLQLYQSTTELQIGTELYLEECPEGGVEQDSFDMDNEWIYVDEHFYLINDRMIVDIVSCDSLNDHEFMFSSLNRDDGNYWGWTDEDLPEVCAAITAGETSQYPRETLIHVDPLNSQTDLYLEFPSEDDPFEIKVDGRWIYSPTNELFYKLEGRKITEVTSCVWCQASGWGDWGPCSVDCGGGIQTRTREVVVPGENCPPLSETRSCNEHCCKQDCTLQSWSSWSSCSAPCNGGTQTRIREVITPATCGGVCPDEWTFESRECNTQCCAVDCVMSEWGEYGPCLNDDNEPGLCAAAGLIRTRTRSVITPASCGGDACPTELVQHQACTDLPLCDVDCETSDWGVWSDCTEPCGGGIQTRTREIITDKVANGAACGDLSQTQSCNTQCCAVDCVPHDGWGPWSGCPDVNPCTDVSETRIRGKKIHALCGGSNCTDEQLKQTRPCTYDDMSCVGCEREGDWGVNCDIGFADEDGDLNLDIPGTGGSSELRGRGRDPMQIDTSKENAAATITSSNGKYFRREAYSGCSESGNPKSYGWGCAATNNFFIIEFPKTAYITEVNAEVYANWFGYMIGGRNPYNDAKHSNKSVMSKSQVPKVDIGPIFQNPNQPSGHAYNSTYQDDWAVPGNFASNIILIEPDDASCTSVAHNMSHSFKLCNEVTNATYNGGKRPAICRYANTLQEDRWNVISNIQTDPWQQMKNCIKWQNEFPCTSSDTTTGRCVSDGWSNAYGESSCMEDNGLNKYRLPEMPDWFRQKTEIPPSAMVCSNKGKKGIPAKAIMFHLKSLPAAYTKTSGCIWMNTPMPGGGTMGSYSCPSDARSALLTTHAVRALDGLPFIKGWWKDDSADPYDLLNTNVPAGGLKSYSRLIRHDATDNGILVESQGYMYADFNKFPPTVD